MFSEKTIKDLFLPVSQPRKRDISMIGGSEIFGGTLNHENKLEDTCPFNYLSVNFFWEEIKSYNPMDA